jgi:cell wall-associated NlpC family hydrolase
VLTAAAATAVALSAQTAAHADPKLTVKQAKSEVDADRRDAAAATEKYNNAKEQQQALQHKVSLLQDEIARQQAVVNQELEGLGQVASSQYAEGAIDPTVQLMLSSDPQGYLQRAVAQDQVTQAQADQLAQLVEQQQLLQREKQEAAGVLAAEQKLLDQMRGIKNSAQAKLRHAQSVLAQLSPAQRAQAGAGYNYGTVKAQGTGSVKDINLSGISAAAQTAMQAAMSKVGVAPYSYGASGPNAFDCSGLVMWAYAQAGVSLPHSSYALESVGTAVPSLADAKVGDIIVNENGGHVGLYAGNGMLLNAPEYGYTVSIQPLSYFGRIVAIRRI